MRIIPMMPMMPISPTTTTHPLRRFIGGMACAVAAFIAATAAQAQTAPACPPAAQVPTAEQAHAGMRDARDRGFLWRLRRDGRVSFLYGTVHVARVEWVYPGPRVLRALNASDTVALELDLLDPEIQRRLGSAMAASAQSSGSAKSTPPTSLPNPLPNPLPTPLPEAMQQRLQRQIEAECLPAQAFAALSPEMQIVTLTSLSGRRDGLDPSYGIDIFLAGWAHAAKKTVVSLETPELQIALLKADTEAERNEFVQSALAQLESGQSRPMLRRMTQAWAEGNLADFASYGEWCECIKTDADRAAMARLLDDRNPALADAVAALHANGRRVFAAVGSLHMAGPMGLPALLAQRGFQVERLP